MMNEAQENIVQNLRIKIENVHIRMEDSRGSQQSGGSAGGSADRAESFAMGLTVDEMS